MKLTDRDTLRRVGQADLGAWVEAASGQELWSIQHDIATELSVYRAKLNVPSCNASGKTFLAGRLALAFYDAFTPGTPCDICGGPCGGSKVLLTSSKEIHLIDNLGGELRTTLNHVLNRGIDMPGHMPPTDVHLFDQPNHFIRGHVATKEEGFQGYHASHKLIIGDEATAVSEDVARGITSLMATGDTRIMLIYNPTTPDTYAAQMSRSEKVTVIRITAYDTPAFTGEHMPEGANLTNPAFLEDLEAQGMGPGSYEWTTRVLAQFWEEGEDTLIPLPWIEAAMARDDFNADHTAQTLTALGVDLSSYGTAESAIAARRGDTLVDVQGYPSKRTDHFIWGKDTTRGDDEDTIGEVRQWIMRYRPWTVVFDADGVGAGAVGDFMRVHAWAKEQGYMLEGSQVIGFRGALKVVEHYFNQRSGWWWALRLRFQKGRIKVKPNDRKTNQQLSQLTYKITPGGAIKAETKDEMRKRGLESPDRGDAVMYAYAFSEELPLPASPKPVELPGEIKVAPPRQDDSAFWARERARLNRTEPRGRVNAVTGIPDDL